MALTDVVLRCSKSAANCTIAWPSGAVSPSIVIGDALIGEIVATDVLQRTFGSQVPAWTELRAPGHGDRRFRLMVTTDSGPR
jgi:hypothetical protein